jgi:hypothetical protein
LGLPLKAAAGRATAVKLQTKVRNAWKDHAPTLLNRLIGLLYQFDELIGRQSRLP